METDNGVVMVQETEMGQTDPTASDVLEEANRAVKEAIEAAGGVEEKKEGEEPAVAKKPETKEEPPAEEDSASALRKKLKAREAVVAERQKAQEEANQIRSKALEEQERAKWMMEQVKKEAAFVKQLKTDPIAAIKASGWDPDDLILALAEHGTPESKQKQQLSEYDRRLLELQKAQESKLEAVERRIQEREQLEQQRELQAREEKVKQEFSALVADEEKYNFLSTLYKNNPQYIMQEGDRVAREYFVATGGHFDPKTRQWVGGQHATLEMIAEYLDEEAGKFYETLSSAKKPSGNVKGSPPKVSKGKPISNASSSERRALSKDLSDLSDEERLEAAKEAVRVAVRATGA